MDVLDVVDGTRRDGGAVGVPSAKRVGGDEGGPVTVGGAWVGRLEREVIRGREGAFGSVSEGRCVEKGRTQREIGGRNVTLAGRRGHRSGK